MSKHTPWTEEEAAKAAVDWCRENQYSEKDRGDAFKDALKWAAVQIENCETIYYRDSDHEERVIVASPEQFELDTHQAKLVGVREVGK